MTKILALAALIVSNSAFANTLFMDASTPDRVLADCQGTVSTQVNQGQLQLVFSGVQMCSNFEIVAANGSSETYSKKLQNGGGSFSIPKRFIDAGRNQVVIQLESNSGKHADQIVVSFKAAAPIPAPAPIPSYPSYPAPAQTGQVIRMNSGGTQPLLACGGSASASIATDGAVNLVFHGVTACSNFSIVSANFTDLNYTKKLQPEGRDGSARGGSFSIPRRFVDAGLNIMYIQMSSNSGLHSDILEVAFLAAPAPAPGIPAPGPVATSPSTSGGDDN